MIEFLLMATRDRLRDNLTFPGGSTHKKDFVRITPMGHPPMNMGDWFVGIDEIEVNSTDKDKLRQVFSVGVWLTKKIGRFAPDRLDEAYTETTNGMLTVERAIIKNVHNNGLLRIAANTLAFAPGGVPAVGVGDSFICPLWYTGRGPTEFKTGEWAGAAEDKLQFAVRMLRFSGGNRIEDLDVL